MCATECDGLSHDDQSGIWWVTPDICWVFDIYGTPSEFIYLAIGIMDCITIELFQCSLYNRCPSSNEFWVYFQMNVACAEHSWYHICLLRLLNMKPMTGDFWNNLRSSSLRRDCPDGREMVELFPLGCTRRPLIDRELSKKVNGWDWSIEWVSVSLLLCCSCSEDRLCVAWWLLRSSSDSC